ncbi:MAG: cobalamin biosynthesis protein [Pseudonocardia sp.]
MRARAVGLLLGTVADALLGDPRRGHPVAGFGAVAAALERRVHADSRWAGLGYWVALVAPVVALGVALEVPATRSPRSRPRAGDAVVTAVVTFVVLGGGSLVREGTALAAELERADLAAARRRLPNLCGRDPASLDAGGIARAGVESLAENTSDAVVAPLLWGAVAGVPGLLGYRAVNTLDAMVGYRSPRYRRFGWAAARLDDVANYVPARVAALLTAAAAPVVGGTPQAALRAWCRDAPAHPSPNAGPAEAAAAGALGVTLGGRTAYAHGVEHRPTLGDGPSPVPGDLRRAARLSRVVGAAAALLAAAVAATRRRPGRGAARCGRGGRRRGAGAVPGARTRPARTPLSRRT